MSEGRVIKLERERSSKAMESGRPSERVRRISEGAGKGMRGLQRRKDSSEIPLPGRCPRKKNNAS